MIHWYRDQRRRNSLGKALESSFGLCECLLQRWSHSRWWQSSRCKLESDGWSSGEVIKDEKVKGLRAKDFGLVILGPLTSPGMLVGRLWAKYQSLQCYIWGNWLRCQQTVAGSSREGFYRLRGKGPLPEDNREDRLIPGWCSFEDCAGQPTLRKETAVSIGDGGINFSRKSAEMDSIPKALLSS